MRSVRPGVGIVAYLCGSVSVSVIATMTRRPSRVCVCVSRSQDACVHRRQSQAATGFSKLTNTVEI